MQGPGIVLAIGLASIHALVPKINVSVIVPEHRWISFAGGVSVGYVFLEIFPELSHAQTEIEHSAIGMVAYLEKHVYLLALLGLLVFYGLDVLALSSRRHNRQKHDVDRTSARVFQIHIAFFAVLNIVFGYLLQDLGEHGLFQCLLFFAAAALHFFIIDRNLREHHRHSYDRVGRWILMATILIGTAIAQVQHFNEATISLVWSFLAGSIILTILKHELPDERQSCFWSFVGGIAVFSGLILSV